MNRIIDYHLNTAIDEINLRRFYIGFKHTYPEGFHQISAKLFTTFTKIILRHQNDAISIVHRFTTYFRYRICIWCHSKIKILAILANSYTITTRLTKLLYIIAAHFIIYNCSNNSIWIRITYLLSFNNRFWTQATAHIYR